MRQDVYNSCIIIFGVTPLFSKNASLFFNTISPTENSIFVSPGDLLPCPVYSTDTWDIGINYPKDIVGPAGD